MMRKIIGGLLVAGSVAVVVVAIALSRKPVVGISQIVGPLFLAAMFLYQGLVYLFKTKPITGERVPGQNRVHAGDRNMFNRLKAATPRCLAEFQTQEASAEFAGSRYSKSHFVTKRVACVCGSQELELLACRTDDGDYLAPISAQCPKCASQHLLFNPAIHGWDGESGASASRVSNREAIPVAATPGSVIVVYSYQGLENYEDLIAEGVANPEDFFDTFAVYFGVGDREPTQVVSYECA
jgi:hypothetical protein